jgi:hypothetical protein
VLATIHYRTLNDFGYRSIVLDSDVVVRIHEAVLSKNSILLKLLVGQLCERASESPSAGAVTESHCV